MVPLTKAAAAAKESMGARDGEHLPERSRRKEVESMLFDSRESGLRESESGQLKEHWWK